LPDGIFSKQKSQFGYLLEGLAMDDVDIFGKLYSHLVHLMANRNIQYQIWYISLLFGQFFPFWYVAARKIWQPCACARVRGLLNRVSRKKKK
jgi:hypothetical protein